MGAFPQAGASRSGTDESEPAIGFEPMTYRLQVGCASGLRHAGGTDRVYPRRNGAPEIAIA